MAEMALEYIFKIFIYIVAVLVIIGIILNFQHIASMFKLPCLFPPCEEIKCETSIINEEEINEAVLKKYCDLCWSKTGEKRYDKDCVCYLIKGSLNLPASFSHPHCNLKCSNPSASSVFIEYKLLENNVTIDC